MSEVENLRVTTTSAVKMQWGVKIPLRDGVHLSATLYLPKRGQIPWPCIVTITPYIADIGHDRGVYFAANGYVFACIDSRGRGNSEGDFRPFIQEAKDGYDAVEWLARQPYCNGKVAMLGGSYSGYNQWAAAKECPPHLATIVPTAAPYMGVDFRMRSNIFYPYLMQWLTFTSGRASQAKNFYDAAFWSAIYREWHESGCSFRDIDVMCGNPNAIFQDWLTHPAPDEYWDTYNPTAQQYAQMQIPILTITGSYDDDQPGALQHYKEHMRNASPRARARHYLVIGPWDHHGTTAPTAEFGGLKFGSASLVDPMKLRCEWYAWTMGNGPQPEFLKAQVAYYVMGAERWRYANTLEEITASQLILFLDSSGTATDIFASGSLSRVPPKGQPDAYTYDPRETHGAEVDAEARTSGGSLVDQSVMLALRGKQLVYHSEPFETDIEISGFFRLTAWIAINCPDTDFYVAVHEIETDGRCIRLSTDAIRARYRTNPRAAMLIQTSEPLRYDFERFTFVSRRIKRGHRLRLIIAPIGRLVETIFAEKNCNGGGVVAEETIQDARPVTVSLFHDKTRRSALYVPVARGESPAQRDETP